MSNSTAPHQLGQGYYWQELEAGQQFRTFRRTVTEADLIGFIGVTGMLEVMFIDAAPLEGGIAGRPVPAALTYTLIEGLLLQTMIQGTGLAMLELTQKIHVPVRVGDSIDALVRVDGIRPTSKGGRAIVDSTIEVFNQRRECVMTYTARRMLAGRAEDG
jgi:3-hydroxybutyryl-CoA dehydratase